MLRVDEMRCGPSGQANLVREADQGFGSGQLLRVLDEIDYGILVVDSKRQIEQANHLARHELLGKKAIVSQGNVLMGMTNALTQQIQVAIEHACRGQRRLALLKYEGRELPAAFIPLSHPLENDTLSVLVLLSRQKVCDNLAVRMFARAQGLSPTEETVMIGLCRGLAVPEIATENGVAPSTVRSQVKSLREKTGCSSIRQLLCRVNRLPPVVPALRMATTMPRNLTAFSHP